MFRYPSLRIFQFLCVCATLLLAKQLQASEVVFDSQSSVKIVRSSVEIYPPGEVCPLEPLSKVLSDFWCIRHRMDFDNGLYAMHTIHCDNASFCEELIEPESGNVNIVGDNYFSLVFEDGELLAVALWVNDVQQPVDLPRIRSLTQHIKTVSYWFYSEEKLEYVIELDDGTSWITPPQDLVWDKPWDLHSRIVRVGTSDDPILINLDSVYEADAQITPKDYLEVKPR